MLKQLTYKNFADLVLRRITNDFGNAEITVTSNEVYAYLFPAIGQVITTTANQYYAAEGVFPDLNSFQITYKFACSGLTKDIDTGDFYLTLNQIPLGLPEGVSIKSPTLIGNGTKSFPLIYVAGYSRNYALKMPTPAYGGYWYNEGSKLTIISGEDLIASGLKLSITMLSSKGQAETDTMNLTDEAFASVFDLVVNKLMQRIMTPKDTTNDGVNKKTEAA
jgi:hypothetical protein